MNRLSTEDRARIIQALTEGNSLRSTSRLTGTALNTVTRVLVAAGHAAADYQDVVMRDLPCKRLQLDEIWAFVYAKAKNVKHAKSAPPQAGDVWTWTAICQDTKLIPAWWVGARELPDAVAFTDDLAGRLANRVQVTTDGLRAYVTAVPSAFDGQVDYSQLVKVYGPPPGEQNERRYSPAICLGTKATTISGSPDLASASTSHAERSNLTMRMGMRRFTRLTNAFSKKLANHEASVALHFLHYNFARPHSTLKGATPAQVAGVSRYRWSYEDMAALLNDPQYADVFKAAKVGSKIA